MSKELPWLEQFGDIPSKLTYPEATMVELVEDMTRKYPQYAAYDFFGKKTNYQKFLCEIEECAKALKYYGVQENDKVTICMPNTPQAIICIYACNMIGAIANIIHPLSALNEIKFYLEIADSKIILTLDIFFSKIKNLIQEHENLKIIVANIPEVLPFAKKELYKILKGVEIKKKEYDNNIISWKEFLKSGKYFLGQYRCKRYYMDPAIILYSGGTTGKTKGVVLSNNNMNACAIQIFAEGHNLKAGDAIVAMLPIFHGFGLGVCVHTAVANGGCTYLMPRFKTKDYAAILKRDKPAFVAGVPTMFEAILKSKSFKKIDLSFMRGMFCGGDALSIELKRNFDEFLKERNAKIELREGYGATECVAASCLNPYHTTKEGSVGIPFPDTLYKIVNPKTNEILDFNMDGEICISGPTVMLEYLKNPKETTETIKIDSCGRRWLYTGDLGYMDEEGYIFFKQRIKRMIVSGGYSIYPSELEKVINKYDKVENSCVIGVKDSFKGQKVKAFIKLEKGIIYNDKIQSELLEYCKKNIVEYAVPTEIEIVEKFPITLMEKVDYRSLEEISKN